ncbi:transcriptional regulator with XRE-family HTH domain [Burkholderia ambifaria]|nr:transcriptional regulator [Burkholderia ambifaria]MDR6498348.1 transcriptional regulator with XRE-family HTH domain [Burkholderia ambifaria]
MQHTIEQASDLGGVNRAARKVQKWRRNDAADRLGVSRSFTVKAECGADAVQWRKAFQVLHGLGVRIAVDLSDASDELPELESACASRCADVRTSRAAGKETAHD